MKALRKTIDDQTYFILTDLKPIYHRAAQNLQYQAISEGFARDFPSDTPHLDLIYENFANAADAMVKQAAGLRPVQWERALCVLLQKIKGQNLNWWLGGSTALAIRDLPIIPGDIDLIVDDKSAQKLGQLLLDHLIEPVEPVQDWFCRWWGRAFWHARIKWVGGVDEMADQPEISDFGPTAAGRLETVRWRGHEISVPPLDLQLAVCKRRGLAARAELIEQAMHKANLTTEQR